MSLLLDKIARANAGRYASAIARLGLRPKHVGLLAAVAMSEHPSQADIGSWLGVGPSAVVALVDEGIHLGIVTREQNTENRRRARIELTAIGRSQQAAAFGVAQELDDDLMSQMPEADRAAFKEALFRIGLRLGIGPSDRVTEPNSLR